MSTVVSDKSGKHPCNILNVLQVYFNIKILFYFLNILVPLPLVDFIMAKNLDILNVGCKSTFVTSVKRKSLTKLCAHRIFNGIYNRVWDSSFRNNKKTLRKFISKSLDRHH